MKKTKDYGIRRKLAMPYDQAVTRIKATLHEQGFGVLSEIDLKAKLKEKLDVDFKRYVILGACNPPLAYKALQVEPEIGLLLPCNVIVYELDSKSSMVAAIDPNTMVDVVGSNPVMEEVARDARERLVKAIAQV
ncbi:MAG: DUF302 domain-containing protein [Thermoanaerobaculia bacterium]